MRAHRHFILGSSVARLTVLGAMLILVALGGYLVGRASRPPAMSHAAAAEAKQSDDPAFVVVLSKEAQEAAGIEVAAAGPTRRAPETPAIATVIDLSPLWELDARLASARADAKAAQAMAQVSTIELRRLEGLHADNQNVSAKTVEAARATAASETAKAEAAQASLQALRGTAGQQFGPVVSKWLDDTPRLLDGLRTRRQSLLRVVVPGASIRAIPQRIHLASPNQECTARYISATPQVDPTSQRDAWLFLADGQFAANARVDAYVPMGGDVGAFTLVPVSAVVWYGGQPWIYLQHEGGRFERRAIALDPDHGADYLVPNASMGKGARVVVHGAQLLFSEEMRGVQGGQKAGGDDDD